MNRTLESAVACLIAATFGGCSLPGAPSGTLLTGLSETAAPSISSVSPGPTPATAPHPQPAQQPIRQVAHEAAQPVAAPLHSGMPAYSRGYTAPPGGCPPRAAGRHAMGAHAGHYGQPGQCTQGCCGTAGPVYPTMPPPSAFGLDAREFLCDGGDEAPLARVRKDDAIIGVGLEDTVVKYETAKGDLHVVPSNRVCIYAPRFASVRRVSGAVTDGQTTGPVDYILPEGPGDVLAPQPSSAVRNPIAPMGRGLAKGPDAVRARDLGVRVDNVDTLDMAAEKIALLTHLSIISDGVLRDADKPWLAKGSAAAIAWSLNQTVEVAVEQVTASVATRDVSAEGLTTYELPGGRLRVIKVADRDSAQVGDLVTFVLRIDNTGEGRLDNVVLTDNLTTRLEYVDGSQTCTKGAEFTTTENDGGSLRLTWKFTDDFEVGEAAIIRFRCRVR